MLARIAVVVFVLASALGALVYVAGLGWLGRPWPPREPVAIPLPAEQIAATQTADASAARALGETRPKQILFGDLHVHSTYSADAFQMALPMAGGDGAHPVADACDFARFCAALDFWSINDHAITLTPTRWQETVDAMRRCDAVGDPENPDVVPFLGWEWTQMGSKPENHYGHKNVIFRGLTEDQIPTRPIAAGPAPGSPPLIGDGPPVWLLGIAGLAYARSGGLDVVRYLHDTQATPHCRTDRPVRELPADCQERAATPRELFAKLDDWGLDALVIPHGTAWGMYTPPGSSWDKQLAAGQHDPARQRIIEVFSGHGSSEEYRSWRHALLEDGGGDDGTWRCPEPTADFLPACWQAGEIIRERCVEAGEPDAECEERAATTRSRFLAAEGNGGRLVVPGAVPRDWEDAGQCRDCVLPAFNYRPGSSVQYILSRERGGERFRFGMIASSDNHSSRPGTGYKEFARRVMTEARFRELASLPITPQVDGEPVPESRAYDFAATPYSPMTRWEFERGASFFLTGGLAAVHAEGRDRDAIFDALWRREVYGTSGPRILLWFDLMNAAEEPVPMGSGATLRGAPEFRVRAVGSREQQPGCPDHAGLALGPERLARLCRDECHHPAETRRRISRIEVVRIRPQRSPGERAELLIEDPWQVHPCPPDAEGCEVRFRDPGFATSGRDATYYVRAIETPSLAVAADPLRCERDASGRCFTQRPCAEAEDDCLAENEERAWSSPIFVEQPRNPR